MKFNASLRVFVFMDFCNYHVGFFFFTVFLFQFFRSKKIVEQLIVMSSHCYHSLQMICLRFYINGNATHIL